MAKPVRRMERAFFERLALVRSGGDSIRRSMAASSFYAAVEAVRAKKNGGSNRTAVNQVLFCAQKAVCSAAVFFFSAAGQISVICIGKLLIGLFQKKRDVHFRIIPCEDVMP